MAKMKVSKKAKKAADTFIRRIKTGVLVPLPEPTGKRILSPEQIKAQKLINWMKCEMARENRIQKSASTTLGMYTNTPLLEIHPHMTHKIAQDVKHSSKLSWEKASGAWLAYAQCIERIRKEFEI